MARAVRKAVAASTLKWYARPGPVDFIKLLDDRGITMEEMWAAANKLVFPNPDWPEGFLKGRFEERMNLLRQDINVNAMVKGAILLEDAGRSQDLYGLDNGVFDSDPVHLLADELMGIALAEYITGTKGLFEYIRYDRKKPGILAELGPFLDDIVGALIGAVMSRIYSDLLEAEGRLQRGTMLSAICPDRTPGRRRAGPVKEGGRKRRRRVKAAFSMFTMIPLDVEGEEVVGLSKRFYLIVLVGAFYGLIAGFGHVPAQRPGPSATLTAGVLAFLVVHGLNRFLHFDGLSDFGDGMTAAVTRRRR